MDTNIIIALVIFAIVTFLLWWVTVDDYKKEAGKKMRNIWGAKVFYWQGTIIFSSGITFLILLLLKWSNVMTF